METGTVERPSRPNLNLGELDRLFNKPLFTVTVVKARLTRTPSKSLGNTRQTRAFKNGTDCTWIGDIGIESDVFLFSIFETIVFDTTNQLTFFL